MSYVIYKIVCDDVPDYVYIGSTIAFRQRKATHKQCCNNPNHKNYNLKIYQIIRENGNWENWRMVIINKCEEGLTKIQAHIIEEEFRVKLNGNLNMVKCYLTVEGRKEQKRNNSKKYIKTNKEVINEKQKEYYETNKQVINEKKKEYYETNKQKIAEKAKEKITCNCGCIVSKI